MTFRAILISVALVVTGFISPGAAHGAFPATESPSGLSAPDVNRSSWNCRGTQTRITQSTPPLDPAATFEVQARMVQAPPGKSIFTWRTLTTKPIRGDISRLCVNLKVLPGGGYEWRMREVGETAVGQWSPVASPKPFYERPVPMRWKWVKLKDIPSGLLVRWKHRGYSGGAPIERYKIELKSKVPVNGPRPVMTCEKERPRCKILNMIEGRRTYYPTIRAYNGHRWSKRARFWVCAGRC